jgi:hypothetical protein
MRIGIRQKPIFMILQGLFVTMALISVSLRHGKRALMSEARIQRAILQPHGRTGNAVPVVSDFGGLNAMAKNFAPARCAGGNDHRRIGRDYP